MDKRIIITGAGGVLGSCFSKALASDGHSLALLNRTFSKVSNLAEEIRASGGLAKAYSADVTDKQSLEVVHRQILEEMGPCDILINVAGGNHPSCITDREVVSPEDPNAKDNNFFTITEEGFNAVFGLNLTGTLLPSQVFAADMIGRKGCCILNLSSMAAFLPLTKVPAYSAAKAGVSNFTQWLAVHLAPAGIRVNALAPGFFVTDQNRALLFCSDGLPTARAQKILRGTPLSRFGEPSELLGAVRFLIDDKAASFVTGVVFPVDGGFSAYAGV
jgi:NAD(P)-dependent dehydrogenase (short-subunit alcohol dehydrogenase family)